jgi:hypothetical protein
MNIFLENRPGIVTFVERMETENKPYLHKLIISFLLKSLNGQELLNRDWNTKLPFLVGF